MTLTAELKNQLKQYLDLLESPVIFTLSVGDDAQSAELIEFVEDVVQLSDQLSIQKDTLELTPSFTLHSAKQSVARITFAGVPLGHEFSSFVLALLQVSGRAPKIEDEVRRRIESIKTPMHFETFVSLSCHNCPDVVQAFNIMSVINENISHTMIEGGMHQQLVEDRGILAVPTVFKNGEEFTSGRQNLNSLIDLIAGQSETIDVDYTQVYDTLVIGGGPAGASAAIYAARKGIKVGLIAKEFGGQVLDTMGIENVIGTPYTEGPKLMAQVREHVTQYEVDMIEHFNVKSVERNEEEGLVWVTLENDVTLKAKTIVIATGARWRLINVPGEKEFKNKGIAYCPHCDGPLFKDQSIAVIGGGNSGVEAALDLAGMAKEVTVLEFTPELKADKVLQERLNELDNVHVITNAATSEISGEQRVEGLTYVDRETNTVNHLDVAGAFILVGLVPNTEFLKDTVEMNERGEIIVDGFGKSNIEGVYAAGDCTNSAFKQIIISMGSGATAALGAYDYLIRTGQLNA
ncbi:alkyl hydroperoxide reductase subunit F [Atopobacter phocae]|uniref:alkyl hydroperoxide reductase subunit F n=1 Tax=Atopobacter phocae TaxID=136492 RepID=UPI0004714CD0|nr:alkyl hydroperoxide reductase subunit F [Atopobacter phocae]